MGARPSSFKKVETAVAPTRQWPPQQQAIFDWFKQPDGSNLVVRARAGTGKTTTVVEGVSHAPEQSILLCAFNKRIAEEMNGRITGTRAVAKTLHSVGYQAIRREWGGMPVADGSKRADDLTKQVCPANTHPSIQRLVSLLHSKGREMMPLSPFASELTALALFFDYVPDESWVQYPLEWVVEKAQAAMQYAAENPPTYDIGIDFADMIYLPLVWQLLSPEYDMVVVDECQDMNTAQILIAQRICRGRMCVVGDNRQAIYSWRGADSNSLDRLKNELDARELPLTTTYRCGRAIVQAAQVLVPDIQVGASNPEGTVDQQDYEYLLANAAPGDFVLSRLNAPLVSTTLAFLRKGKRARMAGRDVGAGIRAILTRLKCFGDTPVDALLDRLEAWEQKTVTRYAAYGQNALVDRCRDQAAMIRALAEEAKTTADLLNQIDWLFVDVQDDQQIICSSIHKAKGLEAQRVYVLRESLYRRGRNQEEENLEYVATTRAKTHLTWVVGVPSLQ